MSTDDGRPPGIRHGANPLDVVLREILESGAALGAVENAILDHAVAGAELKDPGKPKRTFGQAPRGKSQETISTIFDISPRNIERIRSSDYVPVAHSQRYGRYADYCEDLFPGFGRAAVRAAVNRNAHQQRTGSQPSRIASPEPSVLTGLGQEAARNREFSAVESLLRQADGLPLTQQIPFVTGVLAAFPLTPTSRDDALSAIRTLNQLYRAAFLSNDQGLRNRVFARAAALAEGPFFRESVHALLRIWKALFSRSFSVVWIRPPGKGTLAGWLKSSDGVLGDIDIVVRDFGGDQLKAFFVHSLKINELANRFTIEMLRAIADGKARESYPLLSARAESLRDQFASGPWTTVVERSEGYLLGFDDFDGGLGKILSFLDAAPLNERAMMRMTASMLIQNASDTSSSQDASVEWAIDEARLAGRIFSDLGDRRLARRALIRQALLKKVAA